MKRALDEQTPPVSALVRPETLGPQLRETLLGWQGHLEKLIAQRRLCPARQSNRQLQTHLTSAIKAAHDDICRACVPAMTELLQQAVRSLSPYFHEPAGALAAAKTLTSMQNFYAFLVGPEPGDNLDDLARAAEATAELIGRILAGGEVWHFVGARRP